MITMITKIRITEKKKGKNNINNNNNTTTLVTIKTETKSNKKH